MKHFMTNKQVTIIDKKDSVRELRSFTDVYKETKVRITCYVATSTNQWIVTA